MPDNPTLARLSAISTAALGKSAANLMNENKQQGIEKKRATLDVRHRYLLERFAAFADLKVQELENSFLLGNKLELVNDFFKEGGSRKVFFFWQPHKEDVKMQTKNTLVVTDGSIPFTGTIGAYFLRTNTKAISPVNVYTEVHFGAIDKDILPSLTSVLRHVFLPALKAQDSWGMLQRSKDNVMNTYEEEFEKALNDLDNAVESLHSTIKFQPPSFDLSAYDRPEQYANALHHPEIINGLEQLVADWCKQVDNVLAESEQMRREADEIGPHHELGHWKSRMIKFNSILEQIHGKQCETVVGILQAVKSKNQVKAWKELETRLVEAAAESTDNVKYLYSLEKYYRPLYSNNPQEMLASIPALINSIKMIFNVSRFYNTSERMTSLFVKITNQMITGCKQYLTKDGKSILTNDRQVLVKKCQECLKVNEVYQQCFRETKQSLTSTTAVNSKQLELSEMYIFGKFDSFCKRLTKLIELCGICERFQRLSKMEIEGIDGICMKFQQQLQQLQKKPHDLLDQRKNDFEIEFQQFKKQVVDLEHDLQMMLDNRLNHATSTEQALDMISKYSQIHDMHLDLSNKYHSTFTQYSRKDLETIRKLFEKYKENPPIPRNVPDVAGAIMWARQLYRRIERPMQIFQQHTNLLEQEECKKYIKNYNKIAKTLIEYELIWIEAWQELVEPTVSGLQATVLINDQQGNLVVNFDPQIIQLIKECKFMMRLQVELPQEALKLTEQEDYYRTLINRLHQIINEKRRLNDMLPNNIKRSLAPHFDRLNNSLEPGLTLINWTSLTLPEYLTANEQELKRLRELCEKILDICQYRIQSKLSQILQISFCDLPTDECWTIEQFQERSESRGKECCLQIQTQSRLIESSVLELLQIVQESLDKDTVQQLQPVYAQVYTTFNQQLFETMIQATKQSLDLLKSRLTQQKKALLSMDIIIQQGQFITVPRLEDVQSTVNKVCQSIQDVCKRVEQWKSPNGERVEDFQLIPGNKDLQKISLSLQAIVNQFRKEIDYCRDVQQQKYMHLWRMDKFETGGKCETLCDFEQEIQQMDQLEKECQEQMPLVQQVQILLVHLDKLKQSVIDECRQWKRSLARLLNEKTRKQMDKVLEYIDQMQMKLSRKISDLDDLRQAVQTLQEQRQSEVEMEMQLQPIEESYSLLNRHAPESLQREEMELVDSLRYRWRRLQQQVQQTQQTLAQCQPQFKQELLQNIQRFKLDVNEYCSDYDHNGPMVPQIPPKVASERLTVFQRNFDELQRRWEMYSGGEELFSLPQTDYPQLQKVKKELKLLQSLYSLYNDVLDKRQQYQETRWSECQFDKMNTEMQDFQAKIKKLPKSVKDWPAFMELKQIVEDLCTIVPLLEMMSNKALQKRHWQQIMQLCKTEFQFDPDLLQLKTLLQLPLLLKCREEVEEICVSAVKEMDIEQKLKQVVGEWEEKRFQLSAFKTRGNLILKPSVVSEIIAAMEDALMMLSSLMSNRYNAPFKPVIQQWVQQLSTASEVIETWLTVQNLWVYLEAVFVGGDIAKQMPKEAKRFQAIDKSWCKIMQQANDNPLVIYCCVKDETITSLLPHLTEQLEMCQKSLSGYLESKRALFPRFYFVSDPALLEILGQASDSHTIQAHLKSVFDNVQSVQFHEKEYDKIVQLESSEGERVPLSKPVMAQGNVELWLGILLKQMQISINQIIREAASKMNDLPLHKFLQEFPAQIGLLGIQMQFTQMTEDALLQSKQDKKSMSNCLQRVTDILNSLIDVTTKDLSKMDRVKYETLITIQVHHRDVFEKLCKMHCKAPDDFEWLKQCRFYWRETKDACVVSITNFDFTYQCEYLGCTDRLVITPLTDRCYITLAQAMGMSLGGSPAGPAGTGKTETTKDMGKALGKWVVVFNCSDQMDYRGLGRIFKGLAQAGCWGCFDEFNRIELPVLSVAAQQVGCVLAAKRERKPTFVFTDGETVELNNEVGYFITMNPGYAGRVELPENLKVHFRYVAMMVPNREIIIRVKLAGCGFQQNQILAKKFFVLYGLCEQQLSKQVHYDFGLRNILSVLRSCGAVKRSSPQDSEAMIIMRVLRDMNLSKLVDEDESLFMSLINDLFPGMSAPKASYPTMEAAIEQQVNEAGLIAYPPWILKVLQLYETCKVRHGIMVLGPTGAGKTRCISSLLRALTACGEPHKELRMNPKAITDYQMFGRLDVATNDWTDGIFSALWRKTIKKKGEYLWIVLDGPVDAVWIENLNSVLDDNKCLTLANGDRLPMSPTCKLVFEVDSLRNASPATVSRCGMIYMGHSALKWDTIVEAWFKQRSSSETEILQPLISHYFPLIYQFISVEMHPKMELSANVYASNLLNLLTGLLPSPETASQMSQVHLQRLFCFGFVWTMGALLELDERKRLQQFIQNEQKNMDINMPVINNDDDTVYEYFVNEQGEWKHWKDKVPTFNYPLDSQEPEFHSIIVPNVDNVRAEFLIDTIAKQGKGVLLIGEPGTAKTTTIQRYIAKLNPERHLYKTMNFSSATSPNLFQRSIESFVDKRMGTTFGPPAGKKMTVFIDDVNMPEINEWGDQVTAEIVRQLVEYQGFFSLDRPGDWTSIVDLQFLAAMMIPGGGRNDIPARLKRHFFIINCTIPSDASVDWIFNTMLQGHFSAQRGFSQDVQDLVKRLPALTRNLWQQTKQKMLPTPAKFHYIFNLRDLSRIVEGMLKASSQVINSQELLLNLWEHESCRVLPDRFTNQEDVDWFCRNMRQLVSNELGEKEAQFIQQPSFFCDFLRDPPEVEDPDQQIDSDAYKIYERVPSFDILRGRLQEYMRQYNESIRGAKMDLVLFEDAMKHIIRISRILRTPRGNALLVGVGGSGKQSLTRLASFIARNQTFQIAISKNYTTANLMEDLKNMYKVAGLQGKPVTFIFTDNEVKEESFLGYINNILTSGEVANLFAKDEVISIGGDLRGIMRKQRPAVMDTIENLWKFFIDRVKDNLHIVLCFSPVGEKFRNRALKFPGLISGCTMDWFSRWPVEALEAVSAKFLNDMDMVCSKEVKEQVVHHMAYVHESVNQCCQQYFLQFRRRTHVTPKSYLSFIGSYKSMYVDKRKFVGEMADRMNMGLDKLLEAAKSVAVLQEELVVKEKDLIVASRQADEVLAEVTASTMAAEKVKDSVLKVKVKAENIANVIKADKAVAEGQLEAAKPALEEAAAALNSIQPQHIATIRKLAKPPHLIMRIMDGVLLLMKRRIDTVTQDPEKQCIKPSWSEALRLMSQSDFLTNLLNFPKDEINEETTELLEPYLEMPDFNLESAKKVSADVAGLASWVKAMYIYYGINKKVIPLKANLVVQERKLEIASNDLNAAQKTLDEKQAELDVFKAKYDQAISTKQKLQDDADSCKSKMAAATALINGLQGEKDRWTQTSKELSDRIGRLVGDVLLCSAFLSYAGPFNQTFRNQILAEWKQDLKQRSIPVTDDLDLISLLVDNTTIGEWNIQGLPTDELSTQNGILVTKGTRYPLLIDPQGQAKLWIKNREEQRKLQITNMSHKYFRQHVEDCLSQGRPLLIEDVDEQMDPTLDNILEKNLIKSGKSFKVIYGDKEIDYQDGFALYITTKLPNPNYSPEIYAKTSIIDFTVTNKGLEEQLLGRVIMREKQELETERAKMLEEINSNKKKMKQLEDNLLERLTSTKGSLVDDESLIEVLAVTKTTAEEVKEKLIIAAETQKKISVAREEYRPVATRASIIYFLIAEMSMVNCMYQTSLKQFLRLFDESMERSQPSPIPQKRIQNIIDFGTFSTFAYMTRSLYEEHKLMYVLLMALKIDLQQQRISHEEFRCLIKGGASLDINTCAKKPFAWIPEMTWLNLVALSKMPGFQDLLQQIQKNEKSWRQWYEKDSPETEILPSGYDQSLDAFKRLMLVRAWCLDRTNSTVNQYVASALGQRFAEAQILDFEAMVSESNCRTPLIGLLSTGADPSADIEALSKKLKVEMKNISMGQGQEVHARKLVTTFMQSGGWALLQNCHLGISFMEELLAMITDQEFIHEKFRVWITTDVTQKFPINLLQISIKYTNEPPQGLRAGLKRTYNWFTQDTLEISNRPQYKSLLYAVSFLHSIVQERRKFGPIGWNIPYEFNQSDLATSVQFVQNHIDELQPKMPIQWITVRYLLCEVFYGGRVTDDYDRRLLNTFGKVWFGDHMFADTFAFSKGYKIPLLKTIEEFRQSIESLPLVDSPEAFGLHPNADISSQTKTSQKMLDTVLSIQPKDSGGGSGETREEAVKKIANDLLSKLPEDYDKNKVKSALNKLGAMKPLVIFLGQEVDRIQIVLKICREDLQDLKLAIDGTIIMSSRLQQALDALYDARVPANWTKVSWPAQTLGSWFTEVLARVEQFSSWLFQGKPHVFWLSGFFNPQGFLTAIRQEITRAHQGWALDSVRLQTDVTKMMKEDVTGPPNEGVYIHGLFIEGAGWDRKNSKLVESMPKVIYQQMPVIHVSATNVPEEPDNKIYKAPVYKRPKRTDLNYVFEVDLKTAQSPDYWTMRGVGLLAATQ